MLTPLKGLTQPKLLYWYWQKILSFYHKDYVIVLYKFYYATVIMLKKQYQNDIWDSQFRIAWIRLARSQNVGSRTFFELLRIFKTPEEALSNIPKLAERGGRRGAIIIPSKRMAEQEMEQCKNFGSSMILACDQGYPELLLEISDPPPIITTKGITELLKSKKIAIVGTRNASINYCNFAKTLANGLASNGYIVTSGLAKGIDASAHLGSINYGTIGVIAGGINHIYPEENRAIYEMLYKNGLIISEQAFGKVPLAKYFPQRNRIISGLCYGVVIIEAAKKSGTLITAKFALDQGREVFAVPGFPMDPRAKGTNYLIKQGAILVEDVNDVLREMNNIAYKKQEWNDNGGKFFFNNNAIDIDEKELNKYRTILISRLSYSPVGIEELTKSLSIPFNFISLLILELELAGRVERRPDNSICLISNMEYNDLL